MPLVYRGASSIWWSRFCSHLNNETQRKRTNIQNGWMLFVYVMYELHIMDKVTDDLSYVESIMKFSFKWRPSSLHFCYRAGFSSLFFFIVGIVVQMYNITTYIEIYSLAFFGPDSIFFSLEEALLKITTARMKDL